MDGKITLHSMKNDSTQGLRAGQTNSSMFGIRSRFKTAGGEESLWPIWRAQDPVLHATPPGCDRGSVCCPTVAVHTDVRVTIRTAPSHLRRGMLGSKSTSTAFQTRFCCFLDKSPQRRGRRQTEGNQNADTDTTSQLITCPLVRVS